MLAERKNQRSEVTSPCWLFDAIAALGVTIGAQRMAVGIGAET